MSGHKSWEQMQTELFGSPGTPKRRMMDEWVIKSKRKDRFVSAVLYPFEKIPYIGPIIALFWFSLVREGPKSAFHPWGALSFSFLNDGMKPTIYHTWQEIVKHYHGEVGNIWPGGPPKSAKQEAEWTRKYVCGCEAHWAKHPEGAADECHVAEANAKRWDEYMQASTPLE